MSDDDFDESEFDVVVRCSFCEATHKMQSDIPLALATLDEGEVAAAVSSFRTVMNRIGWDRFRDVDKGWVGWVCPDCRKLRLT